jgi:hypothetical protein
MLICPVGTMAAEGPDKLLHWVVNLVLGRSG